MKKVKGVIVEYSGRGDSHISRIYIGEAKSENEALKLYNSREWDKGDGYGSIPYWVDIIIDDDNNPYIPIGLKENEPLTHSGEGW